MLGSSDEDDSDKEPALTEEEVNNLFLEAVKQNDLVEAQNYLAMAANVCYEKDGWNPLLWAACNGNEDIVNLLIKNGACNPYLHSSKEIEVDNAEKGEDE